MLRNIYSKHILVPIKKNEACQDPILLNDVGATIWKKTSTPITSKKLLSEVAITYGLSEGSPEWDAVDTFILNIHEMGLLVDYKEGGTDG